MIQIGLKSIAELGEFKIYAEDHNMNKVDVAVNENEGQLLLHPVAAVLSVCCKFLYFLEFLYVQRVEVKLHNKHIMGSPIETQFSWSSLNFSNVHFEGRLNS